MKDDRNESPSSKLLKGAAVLAIAAVVTKLLGTLQKIPLQNIGGDGVFGIYNTVYPFYMMIITLATAGFPTAISKFVAERHVSGEEAGKRAVLRMASLVMGVLGLAGFAVLYFGAPLLSKAIGSSQLIPALQSAAPALLFIPLSAAIRGYYQGLQDMVPTAVSQVTEQAIRVAVMIVLLIYLTGQGAADDVIAGGAFAGSAAGGAAGLLVMLLYWRRGLKPRPTSNAATAASTGQEHIVRISSLEENSGARLLLSMLAYAIPVCLAALAIPLISLVDTFTLPRLLQMRTLDELQAMVEVGVYNRGIPLVQLITMLASSLSVLFIPALTELKIKGDGEGIQQQITVALRWFGLIGLAASAGLALLAKPINVMLYEDATGSATLAWIAWTAAPGALVAVTAALLQGLGHVRAPALHLLAAAALKTALNALLVPPLGITGAAIAGIAAYSAAAALNLALLVRRGGLARRPRGAWLRPVAALLAMACAVLLVRLAAGALPLGHGRLAAAAESLLGVAGGAAVFAAAVLRLRLLSAAELAAVLRAMPRLHKALRRLRLLA
ncbi:putative polysaccharide biosynthesis protein [Paenibacillus fonticola]|uniref:putative polysaccharide biosynthesis protein n=1 Tax=Paenibacillus fonticola TaxID=379896 RepID=UPI000363D252|nr:polysaccharide biosynthesis protein [Paenibacillus fonticola]